MSTERNLFSETWHRVSRQKIRLRPSVKVRKQFFRGETWHIAHDSYGDQYFRFRPEAWDFIGRLDGTRAVDEIWRGCLERNQDRAPGQGEVVEMLAQLYAANLVISDVPADVTQLFERMKKRKAREWKARLIGIFYLRMKLWDPDSFLERTLPYVKPLLNKAGAALWLILTGLSLNVVVSNWEQLSDSSTGVLDPANLPLLYLAFAFAKVVHEFGHGFAVKRLGGEVHATGITLLVFTPVPYVDATAAWAFRERWKRVWVGAAGMIAEIALAAIASFVWAATGPGLVNALAYNLMVVASVSTLLFNINPLLRFDGYYILSDLTDSPNLQPRATRMLKHLVERYPFGGRFSKSPARGKGEATWLSVFGVASWIYRVFITFTIIIFVADKYFGLGLLSAIITVAGMFVWPVIQGIRYLVAEPRIERVRSRAWWVTGGVLATLIVLLGVIPAPRHFRAPGILKAEDSGFVISRASGFVVASRSDAENVKAGEVIARLESPELELAIESQESELERVSAQQRRAMHEEPAALATLAERRLVAEKRLQELRAEQAGLTIVARADGKWMAPDQLDMTGRWFPRGANFGELVPEGDWEFQAVISQDDADAVFDLASREGEIRFPGSAGRVLKPSEIRVVPGKQELLPSAALGWSGGGHIEVSYDDETGLRAAEPFFLVVANVPASEQELWHGRTGVARFELSPEPLLWQWTRDLRQLLQRRFQL